MVPSRECAIFAPTSRVSMIGHAVICLCTHVLEYNTEIDMHQLPCKLVNEDIRAMAIPNSKYVADYASDGDTPDVVEPH
jgi:hypothetical protein